MKTSGDSSEIPFTAPASIALGSLGPTAYLLVISSDTVKLNRDNQLPIPFFQIAPRLFHQYRLEQYGVNHYFLFIDGELVDDGVPEGPYPADFPSVVFRAKSELVTSMTEWDYIRWGDIPTPGSGDFDSEGDIDTRDFFYFDECLNNGGPDSNVGPGCVWADIDQDGDVDFKDFADFQLIFNTTE